MGVLRASTPITEEDIDDLPRHVERGEDDPGQEEIIGQREAGQRSVTWRISSFVQPPEKKSGTPLRAIMPIA